ncbi:MAG: hypothetical protein GY749_41065 [Desulfobacteraceae bacterium]|nr:hypothetical protein [Desulfobacteraceae bacterium]
MTVIVGWVHGELFEYFLQQDFHRQAGLSSEITHRSDWLMHEYPAVKKYSESTPCTHPTVFVTKEPHPN